MPHSVALKYFIRVKNVGDQVSPLLIEKLLKTKVHHYKGGGKHLLGIGSILDGAMRESFIYGSGFMHENAQNNHIDPKKIFALRGKNTVDILNRNIGFNRDVPLGDPGFLVPKILGYGNSRKKKYRLGIIPHYVDFFNPHIQEYAQRDPSITVLDVALPPEEFFNRLAECENILSSSLHGLIFAEALGIPNLWCEFSNNVVGEGFKFFDWYSLCENPQKKPLIIRNSQQNISDIINNCILSKPNINQADLENALVNTDKKEFCYEKSLIPIEECRSKATPIFMISYNRGNYLKKVIKGYKRQNTPVDIVIHDNGSDDPSTVRLLKSLETKGVQIFWRAKIHSPDMLSNVSETIESYFSSWAEPQDYIVTDCDIDLSIAHKNTVKTYHNLLSEFNKVECIGPMLKIHDIPQGYNLRNRALNRHIEQFWKEEPKKIIYNNTEIYYIPALIDTTFALYRAGSTYRRMQKALRIYNPYEAKHLDWYITKESKDDCYAKESHASISHWNNAEQESRYKDETIDHDYYYIVQKKPWQRKYKIKKIDL